MPWVDLRRMKRFSSARKSVMCLPLNQKTKKTGNSQQLAAGNHGHPGTKAVRRSEGMSYIPRLLRKGHEVVYCRTMFSGEL